MKWNCGLFSLREINKIGSENNLFFNKFVRDMVWSYVIIVKLIKNRNLIVLFEVNFVGLIDRLDFVKKY